MQLHGASMYSSFALCLDVLDTTLSASSSSESMTSSLTSESSAAASPVNRRMPRQVVIATETPSLHGHVTRSTSTTDTRNTAASAAAAAVANDETSANATASLTYRGKNSKVNS